MPDLCLELHDRRAKGVLAGYLDVDKVCGTLVWCIRWAIELPSEMCDIIAVHRLDYDLGELVILDVGNLLCNPTSSIGRHCVCVRARKEAWDSC